MLNMSKVDTKETFLNIGWRRSVAFIANFEHIHLITILYFYCYQ